MTWRNSATHTDETKRVKRALLAAGVPVQRVGHGTGTAWAWLQVYLGDNPGGLEHEKCDGPQPPSWMCRGDCKACAANRALDSRTYQVIREVTGRTGDYNGNVNVLHQ